MEQTQNPYNPLRPLKVAYLCDQSPLNGNLYSGGNARIHESLQKHIGKVQVLSNSWHLAEPLRRLVEALPERYTIRLRWRLHLLLAPIIAMGVKRELKKTRPDVLFTAYSFHSLLGVQPGRDVLTVYTSDASPTVYRESEIGASFKPLFSLGKLLNPAILWAEKRVFRKADLVLWPSDWQEEGARQTYGLESSRARMVPWGANIPWVDAPPQRVAPKDGQTVELLFIGRDWWAKGGPTAFQTLQQLRAEGVNARLTVIGCKPPEAFAGDAMEVYPQLDKAVPEDLTTFKVALERAHFFLLPSFESFGFAFCEAAAYAIPALCLRVGGVPVKDGVNGFALPIGSEAGDFAAKIRAVLNAPGLYETLSQSARREYEERLNWDAWGQEVARLIREQRARLGLDAPAGAEDPMGDAEAHKEEQRDHRKG